MRYRAWHVTDNPKITTNQVGHFAVAPLCGEFHRGKIALMSFTGKVRELE